MLEVQGSVPAAFDNGLFEFCIVVVNHGIPLSLIDGYFSTVKDLFALPLEEKMKILQDENNRGYTPYGEETLDPENQSEGDMKEGYYFGREVGCMYKKQSMMLVDVWCSLS